MADPYMQSVGIHKWSASGKFSGSISLNMDGATVTMTLNEDEVSQIEMIGAKAVEREKIRKANELMEFSAIPVITYDSSRTIEQRKDTDDDIPF